VSVDSRSPYGGVRAVVFVPSSLLTEVPDGSGTRPAASGGAERARTAVAPDVPSTEHGLPKRSRVAVADRAPGPGEPAAPAPAAWAEPVRPPRETAAGLGAWQRGTRSGRAGTPPAGTPVPPPGVEGKDLRP
jgi:hypothetical protein